MKAADTICWNLPNMLKIFGLENKRNCSNIIKDGICMCTIVLVISMLTEIYMASLKCRLVVSTYMLFEKMWSLNSNNNENKKQ